jgi:23S rRNA maturation mini-RNase III
MDDENLIIVATVRFIESFPLTPMEQNVLARGRNANMTARKKNSGGASAYQDSTAFEALLGYTYICDKDRLHDMIHWITLELDELDKI